MQVSLNQFPPLMMVRCLAITQTFWEPKTSAEVDQTLREYSAANSEGTHHVSEIVLEVFGYC